jgi:hypothetical protein
LTTANCKFIPAPIKGATRTLSSTGKYKGASGALLFSGAFQIQSIVAGSGRAIVIFALTGPATASATSSCESDGNTVASAIASFETQNPGVAVTQSLLTGTANGGPYIQSWPSNLPYYAYALNNGALQLSVSPAGAVTGAGQYFNYAAPGSCADVQNGSPVVLASTLAPVTGGETGYSQTLVANGGTAPYNWAVVSGTLPTGLSLDPTTGIITGTVGSSPGSETFTVAATDATGVIAEQSLTIAVGQTLQSPLFITSTSGIYPAVTLTTSGGSPPLLLR